jgi:hypothetical protein
MKDIAPSLFAYFHSCFAYETCVCKELLMHVVCIWILVNSVTKLYRPSHCQSAAGHFHCIGSYELNIVAEHLEHTVNCR